MILFPAIDLKDGQAVRLLRGDLAAATVFNPDPADQARRFAALGFEWLHLVDLNGAVAGRAVNAEAVRRILAATPCPVQLGGGIRTLDAVAAWLEAGVRRVILGTIALTDPGLVKQACRRFPGRIVVGIDARDGKVATEGWLKTSEIKAVDLARLFEDAGVAGLVFTDIERDGALGGANVAATAALAHAVRIPVIASGGVAGLDDLRRLRAEAPKVVGVVIGRALYDGRIDPRLALDFARAG